MIAQIGQIYKKRSPLGSDDSDERTPRVYLWVRKETANRFPDLAKADYESVQLIADVDLSLTPAGRVLANVLIEVKGGSVLAVVLANESASTVHCL